MSYLRRWVGVDPGDRWLGLAILTQINKLWTADMRVVDLKQWQSRTRVVNELGQLLGPSDRLIAEDFTIRTMGYQRFNSGATLRFLGALEYAAECHDNPFTLVPPNDPALLSQTFWGRQYMPVWKRHWVQASSERWHHAFSAWRVLMTYLMMHDERTLLRLRDARVKRTAKFLEASTNVFWPPSKKDLFTKIMTWEVPQ